MDNGAPSEITERGEVKRDMRALEVIPVVRTLSGQAVCAELDRTAEHSESFRRPPTLSSAPSPSFSSSVFFVGLAAIGGRKSSLVRPSLDGRCSRGRDATEGREEGRKQLGGVATAAAAVTQPLFHFPLHNSQTRLGAQTTRTLSFSTMACLALVHGDFMKTDSQVANEDEVQFPPGNSDLSVCLSVWQTDRRTPRPVHKLNKNAMTATTRRASERGDH